MPLSKLPAFDSNGHIHVVIESPRGSSVKLKYDAELDAFSLSRPLVDGATYPYDWGFVPSTAAPDGDPLDALVLWDRSSFPGVVLPCRPVAVVGVEQNSKRRNGERERNDRVIAVPVAAPKWMWLQDLGDIPQRQKEELEAFFTAAVALEEKAVRFVGWSDAAAAGALVRASLQR
jgi:inorganic pyrophosphatase